MNGPGFGRLRLTLPETTEGQGFHVPDVRVGAKTVTTLAHVKHHGALTAAPYSQAGMAADAPELFSPGEGVGRGRAPLVLARVTPHELEGDWPTAWPNRAPKGQSRAKAGSR